MMEQLNDIQSMMAHLKPEGIRMPNSDDARQRAHFRNNTLSYVGVNPQTWVSRATAIHNAPAKIRQA